MVRHGWLLAAIVIVSSAGFARAQAPATAAVTGWTRTVEVDPAGPATEQEFLAKLQKLGFADAGKRNVNWFAARWPNISFIGGMAMGNHSEDMSIFYDKPFKWWTEVLDYAVDSDSAKFGIRVNVRRMKETTPQPFQSFLLNMRLGNLQNDRHPSYILVNGRRVWDSKMHPMLPEKIIVPFYVEESRDIVVDLVADKEYTPDVKGIAFRYFFVTYLGDPGVKVTLKGASDKAEGSPADTLKKFVFGLYPSGYDFYTTQGPKIADLKKNWKHNFRPDYPVDEVFLCPLIFNNPGKGPYHDFMITYGGSNLTAVDAGPEIMEEGKSYIRGSLVKKMDAKAAKAFLDKYPNLQAHWMGGEDSVLCETGKGPHDKMMAQQRKEVEQAKADTGSPGRVKYVYEPWFPALTSAHEYDRGRDILILKNEEDPQANILMAMSRGAGHSFGKPFGFYWEQTHYPFPSLDEKLNVCMLYYLSGGSWIGAELEAAPSFGKDVVADWVFPWVQANRFAMVHPARGTQIVPNAVLWTYGDRWSIPYNPFGQMDTFQRHVEYDSATNKLSVDDAFTHPLWYTPKDRSTWGWPRTGHLSYFIDHVAEMKGYDLLDVFFPKYGDAFTAHITRLLTGTPYGPLDFVYGDAVSTDQLKTYGLIAMLGHATMSPELEKKLRAALENGTNVVMGAQHFKDESGKLVSPFGIDIVPNEKKTGPRYLVTGDNDKSHDYESPFPNVISKKVGNGTLYVYLNEYVSQGGDVLRPLLAKLAAQTAPLKFDKPSDQLEYVAYRKGEGAWAAVFNHGGITMGCDRLLDPSKWRVQPPEPLTREPIGPYKGSIEFNLANLKLPTGQAGPKADYALYEVIGIDGKAFDEVIAGNKPFEVKDIPFDLKDGVIKATVQINKRAQYVIAPKGKGKEVFFGKP